MDEIKLPFKIVIREADLFVGLHQFFIFGSTNTLTKEKCDGK